jgi:hypothetical protein
MNHIVHDVDRDGWGSAALLLADRGPATCRLYPTKDKNVLPLLANVPAAAGDTMWVLDIPAPATWRGFPRMSAVNVIWVDHHVDSWHPPFPESVQVVLPTSPRATTAMSLLVSSRLVKLEGAKDFIRSLCSRTDAPLWARVFDALEAQSPKLPVPPARIAELLALAPTGQPVPPEFAPLLERTADAERTVAQVLDEAVWEVDPMLAVVHHNRATGIPLKRFSLAAAKRCPGRIVVLVHRNRLLYCGRDSAIRGLDLLRHFRSRGLEPKGHAYVCCVEVSKRRIPDELDALRRAIAGESR